MGLANLVPGISGGTMLLAAGIYQDFITAVAEVSTFRFKKRSIVLLLTVVLTVAFAILFFAGPVRDLVIDHRWVMYSLFIGLTLGGAPLVWKLARPVNFQFFAGIAGGMAIMLLMAIGLGQGSSEVAPKTVLSWLLLLFSGLAGASAMILPGVSGGYLLLLLGQYERILGAVDQVKNGVFGSNGMDLGLIFGAMGVVIPVGIGVVIGIVGVSNLLKWLMNRYEKPTFGALVGLLFGAVVGLWPFQSGREPVVGEMIRGFRATQEFIAQMDPADWPIAYFSPSAGQMAAAICLIAVGFGVTILIARVGNSDEKTAEIAISGENSGSQA